MSVYSVNTSLLSTDESARSTYEKPLPTVTRHAHLVTLIRHWCKGLVRWWWAWEVLATAISITATISLIIVLSQADGRLQKSWTFGAAQLTINTIVALLSTVIRAALLGAVTGALNQSLWNRFLPSKGGASGPARPLKDLDTFGGAATDAWGSLKLLWRTKGFNLAALGALLTILSLAFDAFAQQVLTIGPLSVGNKTTNAAVAFDTLLPRALNYTGVALQFDNDGFPQAPPNVVGAIVSSILNNASLPIGSCPTGSCTWPTTPTLGVCSTCSTITLTTVSGPSSVTYSAPWGDLADDEGSVSLTFQNTPLVNQSVNISVLASSLVWNLESDGRLPIINFYVSGIPPARYQTFNLSYPSGSFSNIDFIDPLMVAYNCSLSFCLQSFSASTTVGKAQQRSVGSWGQMTGLANESWTFTDVPANMNMNIIDASAYTVDASSLEALGLASTPFLTGSVGSVVLHQGNMAPLQYAGPGGGLLDNGKSFTELFYDASNSLEAISALSQQIADGMTTYLRTSRNAPPDVTFAPTVYFTEIVVRVRWAWLTFPLGLLVVALVFLVTTILQTRQLCVRPWKDHRLPLLMADVDDVVRRMAKGGLDTRNGLEERVGRMTVQLEFDEKDKIIFRRVQ